MNANPTPEILKERFEAIFRNLTNCEPNDSEIAAMEKAYNMALPQWVRVSKEYPNMNQRVLCFTEQGKQAVGIHLNNDWYLGSKTFDELGYAVTHWMPLPPNPKD